MHNFEAAKIADDESCIVLQASFIVYLTGVVQVEGLDHLECLPQHVARQLKDVEQLRVAKR